ncbi:MAG TPA: hypothetical protein VKY89_16005 [Thermoanaerobaculia bacterium]|nr:hypothetical protein [Thermoanaerobaculia bacterium]
MLGKRTLALPALAAAAYLAAAAAAAAVGFRFWIPWVIVQLLDRGELQRAPLTSLLALHAQPPLLNAVLAAAIRLGAVLGCGPETLLSVLFFLLGGAVVVLLARLVASVTGSAWLAIAAVLLTVADPALHVYRTVYFYELPLAALLLAALAAAAGYLASGRERQLLLFVLALAGMGLLRSLYHPVWAAAMFAVLVAGRARLAGRQPHLPHLPRRPRQPGAAVWLRGAALLAVLLALWPLKNALLFGAPVTSSWVGYNLSRGTPVQQPELDAYVRTGVVDETLRRRWQDRAPAFLRDAPVLAAPTKNGGVRNWNHYIFLLTYRQLESESLAWRRDHPGEWLRQSFANYLLWGRPSYVESYWQRLRGPDSPLFRGYAAWHQRLLFPDLRALVVGWTPAAAVHRSTVVWGGPAPYTFFIVAGLPLLLVALALLLPGRLARGPDAWVALLAAMALVWVLAVPCLTDGTEGNRMRYPVSPCVLLLTAWAAAAAWQRLRPGRAPAPPAPPAVSAVSGALEIQRPL